MVKIAVFPGTFDPFTVGHKDIVCRALQCVADEVIVAVGVNADKKCGQTVEERIRAIEMLYKDDLEYERDIAEVNRRLTGIETVLLYCDPALACISSSMVRELRSYGREI